MHIVLDKAISLEISRSGEAGMRYTVQIISGTDGKDSLEFDL